MVAIVTFARGCSCKKEVRNPIPVRRRVLLGARFWPHGKGSHAPSGVGLFPPGNVPCGRDKEVVLKALNQTVETLRGLF